MNAASRDRAVFGSALALGALGWIATALGGAMSLAVYYFAVIPLTLALLPFFGYLASRGAWRWPALVFGAQLATMIALRTLPIGGLRGIEPLALALFALFAGLGLGPTYLGVALRRARQRRRAARFAAAARRAEFSLQADDPR